MAERSKELIMVGYFLSRFGKNSPPTRLNTTLSGFTRASPLFILMQKKQINLEGERYRVQFFDRLQYENIYLWCNKTPYIFFNLNNY
jgi:hypothetical protein